ncbi:MAG TPA: cytochrome c [Thermoanaerobaculia bacterium]|nr:cytochrome c [Thermoanaerobaculia bacterium]
MRRTTGVAAAGLAAGALLAVACGPDPSTPEGLYYHQCARCHGVDGTGNPRAAKKMEGLDLTVSEMIADADGDAVRERIVEGEGSMPPFGNKLTAAEIDVLVAYTMELAVPAPP